MTAPQLSPWTAEESAELRKDGPFWRHPVERKCPNCGHVAVRTYMFYSVPDPVHPRVISKTWCASCWRFGSWTSDGPPVPFTDPLDGEEPVNRKLEFINKQWDKGVLPQKFG